MNKINLKIQDEKLDIQGKLEKCDGKEMALKEEIHILEDQINGKDLAINHLSDTLMQTGNEN